jgi:hypothetical protein
MPVLIQGKPSMLILIQTPGWNIYPRAPFLKVHIKSTQDPGDMNRTHAIDTAILIKILKDPHRRAIAVLVPLGKRQRRACHKRSDSKPLHNRRVTATPKTGESNPTS